MQSMRLFQVQSCIVCGGETERRLVDLEYEVESVVIEVKGVPAAVCTVCGEQYIPGEFAVWLGDKLAEILHHVRELDGLEIEKVQARYGEGKLVPPGVSPVWAVS